MKTIFFVTFVFPFIASARTLSSPWVGVWSDGSYSAYIEHCQKNHCAIKLTLENPDYYQLGCTFKGRLDIKNKVGTWKEGSETTLRIKLNPKNTSLQILEFKDFDSCGSPLETFKRIGSQNPRVYPSAFSCQNIDAVFKLRICTDKELASLSVELKTVSEQLKKKNFESFIQALTNEEKDPERLLFEVHEAYRTKVFAPSVVKTNTSQIPFKDLTWNHSGNRHYTAYNSFGNCDKQSCDILHYNSQMSDESNSEVSLRVIFESDDQFVVIEDIGNTDNGPEAHPKGCKIKRTLNGEKYRIEAVTQRKACQELASEFDETYEATRSENIYKAGFDCLSPKLSNEEKRLCTSPSLSTLDLELTEIYNSLSDQAKKKLNQSSWLKKRNELLNANNADASDKLNQHYTRQIVEMYRALSK